MKKILCTPPLYFADFFSRTQAKKGGKCHNSRQKNKQTQKADKNLRLTDVYEIRVWLDDQLGLLHHLLECALERGFLRCQILREISTSGVVTTLPKTTQHAAANTTHRFKLRQCSMVRGAWGKLQSLARFRR